MTRQHAISQASNEMLLTAVQSQQFKHEAAAFLLTSSNYKGLCQRMKCLNNSLKRTEKLASSMLVMSPFVIPARLEPAHCQEVLEQLKSYAINPELVVIFEESLNENKDLGRMVCPEMLLALSQVLTQQSKQFDQQMALADSSVEEWQLALRRLLESEPEADLLDLDLDSLDGIELVLSSLALSFLLCSQEVSYAGS
ncbi:MAG: hypothetical protein KC422_25565 [Trueperaceae bacterium]|nr:hypothetical protein [Trueperaceae bacterium]